MVHLVDGTTAPTDLGTQWLHTACTLNLIHGMKGGVKSEGRITSEAVNCLACLAGGPSYKEVVEEVLK